MAEQHWQIQLASDVNADVMLAEVSYRGELWAAVVESGEAAEQQPLRLQPFPRSSPTRRSDAWDFDYEEAVAQLERARRELRP